MIKLKGFLLILTAVCLWSCESSRWDVDTSKIDYDGEILRLDQALFDEPSQLSAQKLRDLESVYGPFLDVYLMDIMQIGSHTNPMTPPLLGQFVGDRVWQELQADIESVHPNLELEQGQLAHGFKRYAAFFNTDTLPEIITYNSGFNIGVYPSSAYLGIGLEWYSGSDLDVIDRLPPDMFPQYKRDAMQPKYLVPNALKGWVLVKHQEQLKGETVLSRLVFEGKIHYITHVLLEETPLEDVFNFSYEQLMWCEESAYGMWKYLLENDLVYSNDLMLINKLVGAGPFTPGMPPESPGGAGRWIGYDMVSQFMESNDQVSLKDLMYQDLDKAILNNYRP